MIQRNTIIKIVFDAYAATGSRAGVTSVNSLSQSSGNTCMSRRRNSPLGWVIRRATRLIVDFDMRISRASVALVEQRLHEHEVQPQLGLLVHGVLPVAPVHRS